MLIWILIIVIAILAVWALSSYLAVEQVRQESVIQRPMDTSGFFSLVRESPSLRIREAKPSLGQVREWLEEQHPNLAMPIRQKLIDAWLEIENQNIQTIEVADHGGVETFGYEFHPKALELCPLMQADTYITREMIYHHPELIPPFFVGDTTRIVTREAWSMQNSAEWVPLLPRQGSYQLPDWRFLVHENV
jgi:hypothetical protein